MHVNSKLTENIVRTRPSLRSSPRALGRGTVPVALLVVPPGAKESDAQIAEEVINLIRESVGAVASVKSAAVVKALPKTRSGKILRGVMKRVCDGQEYNLPGTIEDASVMEGITATLKSLGYPAQK